MARRKISQAEAHRLLARVNKLELQEQERRNSYHKEWPDGVHITSFMNNTVADKIRLARQLKHAVVVSAHDSEIYFYAVPLIEEKKI